MSHRKATKRRRETGGDDDFSPSLLPQKKRSKSHNEVNRNESPPLALDDTDTAIRRSSRTPKPKVFDDEEKGRTADLSSSSKPDDFGLIQSGEPFNSSKKQRNAANFAAARYDDGHKRETRRSYQHYLEELNTEKDVTFKQTRGDQLGGAEQMTRKKEQSSRERKIAKSNSSRRKSDVTGQVDTTPKSTGITQKTPKGTSNTRVKREIPDEPSPKVRTSSRTPIPKRIFSLIDEKERDEQKSEVPGSPGVENESSDLTSPKVRSSSRAHVPKKSFPLLDTKEAEPDVPEQAFTKTRTPKLQGTKRRLSTAAEGSDQNPSKSTPATPEEPSPKVRVSSRGHKPKRTFSLLEGDEDSDKVEEESNLSEKEEKFVLSNLIEQQQSAVTKESKRRRSSNGQQLSKPRPSSKEELKLPSNHGSEMPHGVFIKVEESEASGASDNSAVKPLGSCRATTGRTRSEGSKDDQDKGRISKRKGKPMKKKVAASEEPQMFSLADVKVKVEAELCSDETMVTPKVTKPTKATKPKEGSSKKKQTNESSTKQSKALGKSVAVKQESVENTNKGFSLSDIAMSVIDNSAASSDLNTSVSKVKRKGKLSKNTKQKTNKVKDKVSEKSKKDASNSDSKTKEHKHIILKLQLPQADDSPTKHKKHHHHHHHHHHKHKHSGSHEDGSPKKSHHKKSAAQSPDNSLNPDGKKKVVAKKKISIKFKGLSNTDLEMADDIPEQNNSVGLDTSEKHSKESNKKKKKSKKADSRDEEPLLSSSQSESERVKLVIKKDKIPPGGKAEEVKTKKITKPAASSSGVQKKKPTSAAESKKGKGSSTPGKKSKTPQVQYVV